MAQVRRELLAADAGGCRFGRVARPATLPVRIRGLFGTPTGLSGRGTAVLGTALAALLLAWRLRGRGIAPFSGRPATADPPLPRAYARLVRRLAAGGRRRSAGIPLETTLREATARVPALLPPTDRFLSLYHRDRFGPHPLSAAESEEAARLADFLRRELPRISGR